MASSPRDLDQAFAKYAKHCDKNEYVQIGECYLEGVTVEQNTERALSYLKEVAKRKVPRAMALLGEIYLFGHYVEKDLEQAIDLLHFAAKYEEPRALILLSRCYQLGLGSEQDEEASDSFYDRFQDAG